MAELGDKQSLTRHWEAVLYDEKRARELADNARQYVMDHFSGHRMAQEYDALFKKLLAKTG